MALAPVATVKNAKTPLAKFAKMSDAKIKVCGLGDFYYMKVVRFRNMVLLQS